jgi:plasmid stability protein
MTLSIKNVPDELAQRLKERAARNHRSLQGATDGDHRVGCEPNPSNKD